MLRALGDALAAQLRTALVDALFASAHLRRSRRAGFKDAPWFGLALPARAPPALVERLARALRISVASPSFQVLLARSGGTTELSASPEQFAARLRDELEADAALLAGLGIKAE
jgi:tripartite-type tricarboxylate transporter receptor subunit TctC